MAMVTVMVVEMIDVGGCVGAGCYGDGGNDNNTSDIFV